MRSDIKESTMKPTGITRRTAAFLLAAVSAAILLAAAVVNSATAQVPDTFTNLHVFPADISRGELIGTMRDITGALGVRCNHCHVGPDNLQGMDFATDEKATKRTARAMLKMVKAINGTYLSAIETGRPAKAEVQCQTCHHGLAVPAQIGDVVMHALESDGVGAAMKSYRELREKHYGSDAYDFSQTPINSLAEDLARSGKLDESLALLRMNVELHPDDSYTRAMHGEILKAMGRMDEAVEAYRKAVELDPDSNWIRQELAKVEAEAAKKPE
jgi:hypothetical protein